jgi:hypothetical protein
VENKFFYAALFFSTLYFCFAAMAAYQTKEWFAALKDVALIVTLWSPSPGQGMFDRLKKPETESEEVTK